MERDSQENYLRILDKAVIETALEDECEYQFTGVISTCGKNTTPNGEGGESVTHKAKFTGAISLIKGDKSLVKGRDKTKASVRLRKALEKQALEQNEDSESYYQKRMNEIIWKVNEGEL